MKILITGGTGLLGKALVKTAKDSHRIWAVYLGEYKVTDEKFVHYFNADICDKDALGRVFCKASADIVIHTAGIANVDYCEKNYDQGRRSNIDGTVNIIEFCKKYRSKIVFVSTNAVFDGKKPPYSEKDTPSPLNKYGRIKLECEDMIKNSGLKYIIARPILMYGWNHENERANSVTWLIQKLRNGEHVNMVNDIYENPILNLNCAEIIWALVEHDKKGIYHMGGRDIVNRYEFAKAISETFGFRQDSIHPVSSGFFPGLAPRPANTSYDTGQIERELNIRPSGLKEGLALMKKIQDENIPSRKHFRRIFYYG